MNLKHVYYLILFLFFAYVTSWAQFPLPPLLPVSTPTPPLSETHSSSVSLQKL